MQRAAARRRRPASSAAGSGSSHSSRRRSAGIRRSASVHDAASNTYQSFTSRCASTCSTSSAEAPHLLFAHDVDRRRRGDRVVVVDELQERFLDVTRPRLEEDVAATDAFFARHVLEDRQHLLAQGAREDVVEVFRRARTRARVAVLERPPRRVDVGRRVDERQQFEDPVPAAASSARAGPGDEERIGRSASPCRRGCRAATGS